MWKVFAIIVETLAIATGCFGAQRGWHGEDAATACELRRGTDCRTRIAEAARVQEHVPGRILREVNGGAAPSSFVLFVLAAVFRSGRDVVVQGRAEGVSV